MGRELRMVHPDWEHPTDGFYNDGAPRYVPLFQGYNKAVSTWDENFAQWRNGFKESWLPGTSKWVPHGIPCGESIAKDLESFTDWYGSPPKSDQYMPEWAPNEATKLVMYEDTSEGTPISPKFDTPEELAQWLADTGASAFGSMTASYESWLATIKQGYSVGAVIEVGGELVSGVDANNR